MADDNTFMDLPSDVGPVALYHLHLKDVGLIKVSLSYTLTEYFNSRLRCLLSKDYLKDITMVEKLSLYN